MSGAIVPGFGDPVLESQRVFRALLDAMAEPLRIVEIEGPRPPEPLLTPAWALALTLFDTTTPVWIDRDAQSGTMEASLRFHCGCPLVATPSAAAFAIVTDILQMPPLDAFNQGSLAYPDRSTTVIVQGIEPDHGAGLEFEGPGIDGARALDLHGVPSEFWRSWKVNEMNFPCGVDVIFVTRNAAIGLPRSARLTSSVLRTGKGDDVRSG